MHVAQRGSDQPVVVVDRPGRLTGTRGQQGTWLSRYYINAAPDRYRNLVAVAMPNRFCASIAPNIRPGARQSATGRRSAPFKPSDGGGADGRMARFTSPMVMAIECPPLRRRLPVR